LEQPFAQGPVHILGRHDVLAGLEGPEDAGEGGSAGGEQERTRTALDRGQHGLGGLHRRIVRAAIAPGTRELVVAAAHIGGGGVHRRYQGAGGLIDGAEGPGHARGDVEVGALGHGGQRCWYWVAPNRTSLALVSMGALRTLSAK